MSAGGEVSALERGQALVDLSDWWKVGVGGSDAPAWLNDLLSTELEGLAAGEARRSLLLSPTGRIRAAITVCQFEAGHLLIQDPIQPLRIDELLRPYVLSSDVSLRDLTEQLGLVAFPGGPAPAIAGSTAITPSVLGPGTDVLSPAASAPQMVEGFVEAGPEQVEAWRIRRGMARFGVDLTTDSLPHEAEPGELIAYGKGCFLGQEAVARVRNLGHPPFVLLAATADGPAAAGDRLMAGERDAGWVTSAVTSDAGTAVIARVRWGLKDEVLRTASGSELRTRGLASAA
jgi:hypothetical protein